MRHATAVARHRAIDLLKQECQDGRVAGRGLWGCLVAAPEQHGRSVRDTHGVHCGAGNGVAGHGRGLVPVDHRCDGWVRERGDGRVDAVEHHVQHAGSVHVREVLQGGRDFRRRAPGEVARAPHGEVGRELRREPVLVVVLPAGHHEHSDRLNGRGLRCSTPCEDAEAAEHTRVAVRRAAAFEHPRADAQCAPFVAEAHKGHAAAAEVAVEERNRAGGIQRCDDRDGCVRHGAELAKHAQRGRVAHAKTVRHDRGHRDRSPDRDGPFGLTHEGDEPERE
mmetsp:Transcript_51507/g.158727  ORF Transcript_51507/g.158727 Transcript_51507/m.158727 type:complete len:279 (-) Transcript_51507:184-1020(-)